MACRIFNFYRNNFHAYKVHQKGYKWVYSGGILVVIGMQHDSNEVAKEDETLALDYPAELLPLVLDD